VSPSQKILYIFVKVPHFVTFFGANRVTVYDQKQGDHNTGM